MRLNLGRVEVLVIGLVCLFGLVGCGERKSPVSGIVKISGGANPERCLVVFEGTSANGKLISARGEVAKDGSYRLSTDAENDGVPLGKYKVIIAAPPMVDAEARQATLFHSKFSDFKQSNLEYEVKAGKNQFDINLTK